MKTHVQILQIFSYILGALNLLWGAFFLAYVGCFSLAAVAPTPRGGPPFPVWVLILIFGGFGLLIVTNAVMNLRAGVLYPRLTSRSLLIATAIYNCVPFLSCMYVLGIPVGIYSLVILFSNDGIRAFERVAAGTPAEKVLNARAGAGRGRDGDWDNNTDTDVEVEDGDWDEVRRK